MKSYDIEQHKRLIEIQLNNKNDEEEINKLNELVRDNLFRIYIETEVSMREFSLLSDISASTFKRLFNGEKTSLNLKSLLKLSINLNIPIECMVSNLTPEDIELVKKFHQLDTNQRKAVEDNIKQLTMHQQQKKQKAYKKKKKYTNPAGQINIFDYLQKIEESKKDKQK